MPAVVAALLLLEAAASADVTGVSVASVNDIGQFAGKPYRQAALQIHGTAPAGPYRVPAVLAYPVRRSDSNGFALVEPYNTVGFWFRDPLVPETPLWHARTVLGDEYLLGRGSVFIAVLWDEALMEAGGEGFMSAGSDGYEVLRDASALVRSPGSMPYPEGFKRPPRRGVSWPPAIRARPTSCATSTSTARTRSRARHSTARCSRALPVSA